MADSRGWGLVTLAGLSVVLSPPVWSRSEHGFSAQRDGVVVEVSSGGAVSLRAGPGELRLETHSPPIAAASPAADVLRVERDELVEEWVSGAVLEHRWRFDRRPSHEVALEVRSSAASAEPWKGGVRLVSAEGLVVTYGAATWVDATGTRTPIETELDGTTLRYRLSAALLGRSQFPAVLDPVVIVETRVAPPQPVAPAAWAQTSPAIALRTLTEGLVAWEDHHVERSDGALIAAASFDPATGAVAWRVTLSQAGRAPSVAAIGSGYLVVWSESLAFVRAAFVTPAGDVTPVTLASSLGASHPVVTAVDDSFVTAWAINSGSSSVGTQVVFSDAGAGGSLNLGAASPGIVAAPALAGRSGGQALVVYRRVSGSQQQLAATLLRVGNGGVSASPSQNLVSRLRSTRIDSWSVSSSPGGEWAVSWADNSLDAGPQHDIFLSVVSDAGVPQPFPTLISADDYDQVRPVTARVGNAWVSMYQTRSYDMFGGPLGPTTLVACTTFDGVTAGPQQYPINLVEGSYTGLSQVAVGTGRLVAFSSSPQAGAPHAVIRLTNQVQCLNGAAGLEATLSRSVPTQESPTTAWFDGGFQLVWVEGPGRGSYLEPGFRLKHRTVFVDGGLGPVTTVDSGVLDPVRPRLLSGAGGLRLVFEVPEATGTSLVSTGYSPGASSFSMRMSSSIARFPVRVERRVAVADDGLGPVAAWFDADGVAGLWVPGLRWGADGGDVGALQSTIAPALAARAGQTLLVTSLNTEVSLALVNRDAGVALVVAESDSARLPTALAATTDGRQWFVVWESQVVATGATTIRGVLSLPDAGFSPAFEVLQLAGRYARQPSVSFDGTHFVVAAVGQLLDGGGSDVSVRWLDLSTQAPRVVDSLERPTTQQEVLVEVASNGARVSAITTQSLVDAPDFSSRADVFLATPNPLGNACTVDTDCFSGFCRAGHCCERSCDGACEACTAAGVCVLKSTAIICRASVGVCDPEERCDGLTGACAADLRSDSTILCRSVADAGADCDVPERCDGNSAECPADLVLPRGTTCQNSTQVCRQSAVCDGQGKGCPPSLPKDAGTVCAEAASVCELPGVCDGVGGTCVAGRPVGDGTPCGAAEVGPCGLPGRCEATVCRAQGVKDAGVRCQASTDSCFADALCDGVSDRCPAQVVQPNAACGDGGICNAEGLCVERQVITPTPTERRFHYGCQGCSTGAGVGLLPLVLALMARRRARRRRVRSKVVGAALGLAVALAPGLGRAEEPLRLAFVGLSAQSGVTPEQAAALSDQLQTVLSQTQVYRVTSRSDIITLLGLERQRQLLGCTEESTSCMEEIAGALASDRLLSGSLAKFGTDVLLNLSLMDVKSGSVIVRVGRKVDVGDSTSLAGLDGAVTEAVYELVNAEPARKGLPALAPDREFGGFMLAARADFELLGRSFVGGVQLELSGRYLGLALDVIAKVLPGLRLEGRYYPFTLGRVRPMVAVGATAFSTGVGLRGALGATVRFGHVQVFADVAYERFFQFEAGTFEPNVILLGLGAGWAF